MGRDAIAGKEELRRKDSKREKEKACLRDTEYADRIFLHRCVVLGIDRESRRRLRLGVTEEDECIQETIR